MTKGDHETPPRYVAEAIASFDEIMESSHRDMVDGFNRKNKGELFVLHFLALRNAQVLPSELSAALQSSTARISALLAALEKKGQIVREIDKSNRRNILVTITEKGRARIKAEMQTLHASMARVFTDMGETDTVEFIRLLGRFAELSKKYMPGFQEGG